MKEQIKQLLTAQKKNKALIDYINGVKENHKVETNEDDKLKRVISSTPIYEIENIPAESYFKIEDIDSYEDGLGDGTNISYYAEEIHWENGDVEKEGWSLGIKSLRKKTFFNEGDELNLTEVSLKKKKIGEEEGYVK